jgi:hypothetical protein
MLPQSSLEQKVTPIYRRHNWVCSFSLARADSACFGSGTQRFKLPVGDRLLASIGFVSSPQQLSYIPTMLSWQNDYVHSDAQQIGFVFSSSISRMDSLRHRWEQASSSRGVLPFYILPSVLPVLSFLSVPGGSNRIDAPPTIGATCGNHSKTDNIVDANLSASPCAKMSRRNLESLGFSPEVPAHPVRNSAQLVTEGLLKNVRLPRRCAPRNDRSGIFMSLRAIQRIARQSQVLGWDFFNSPTDTLSV